jgi:hypothetical protein
MKKFYLLLMAVTALYSASMAQTCHQGFANPVISTSTGTCRVLMFAGLPNASILVYNAVGVNITIGSATTDANGLGSVFYDCNSSPASVATLTATQTCFATVTAPTILPIKLQNYNALLQNNNNVKLQWNSSFESNSYKYVVQKSTDGKNYISIGDVEASGNSTNSIAYSFQDKQSLNGAAYYRLQMIDIDGSISYSKIVYISNKKGTGSTLSVFPNPFRSDIQLVGVTTGDINKKTIRVYAASGKEMNYSVTGANAITIDPSAPRGVYILRVKEQTYKLIKE